MNYFRSFKQAQSVSGMNYETIMKVLPKITDKNLISMFARFQPGWRAVLMQSPRDQALHSTN
jgi:hypothetical protein